MDCSKNENEAVFRTAKEHVTYMEDSMRCQWQLVQV